MFTKELSVYESITLIPNPQFSNVFWACREWSNSLDLSSMGLAHIVCIVSSVRHCLPNQGRRRLFFAGQLSPLGCIIFVTLTFWRSVTKLIKGLCWKNIKAKGEQLESKQVPCLSIAFYLFLFKLISAHKFFLINKSRKFLNVMGYGVERENT